MKISLNDFLLSHKKTVGLANVEKIIDSLQSVKSSGVDKTIRLTITGSEVHSGEPVVDYLKNRETLKDKIARFERLEKNMAYIRSLAYHTGAISFGDDNDDDLYDFDFANDNSGDVDSFGDPFEDAEEPSVAKPEMSAGKPAQPTMPAGEVSSSPGDALDVSPADVSASGIVEQTGLKDVQK